MKNYRLKKEAVPFMLEKYATQILPLDTWESNGIDIKALEEVKPIFLSYGRQTSEISKTLCGWNNEGSHFEFTINFPSVQYFEHDKFSKGRIVRELMDKIQYQIDDFYTKFVSEENK